MKILLVEDDAAIVGNLTAFLQREGFAVDSTPGQSGAMAKLAEASYDLVLLDISLRDDNGFAVCSYLREHTDTPMIFLTASGDEYSVVAGLDMGADDYIAKPFRPRELVSRIRSVLRRRGRTQAAFEAGGVRVDTLKGTASWNRSRISSGSRLPPHPALQAFHNWYRQTYRPASCSYRP